MAKTIKEKYPNDPKKNLTADEMSIFYKEFLDQKWKTHLEYNKEWQKSNHSDASETGAGIQNSSKKKRRKRICVSSICTNGQTF